MTVATDPTMRWDLSDLYQGPTDPAIDADLQRLKTHAADFRRRFHGRVLDLAPRALLEALQETEQIHSRLYRLMGYASLIFSADTESETNKALYDRLRSEGTAIGNELQFFDVEIKAMPEERFAPLLQAPELATYRYFLQTQRKFAPYTLGEPEERVVAIKDLTGIQAWAQLYTEISAGMRIPVTIQGETKEVGVSEMRALRTDPDRRVREEATKALFKAHADRSHVLTYIFNTLYQDHAMNAELRGYPSAIAPTLLSDDLSDGVVNALMEATEANYDVAQAYYRLKAKALGISDFASYDALAPYAETVRSFTFDQAKGIVLDTFGGFSRDFEAIARRFFDGRWIDVPPAKGKRGGAFCAGMVPDLHPYVMLNFNGRMEDVATLAHELGHGIHFVLSGGQSLYNYHAVTPLAETASTFAEIVVLDRLLAEERDPRVRLQLLAKRLEDAVGTIFRQVMYTRWELRAHARRADGTVSPEDYCALWSEEVSKLYGPAVRMTELDKWGWSTIPHLVLYRFYCYSYAFGQLLVYALYQQYKEEGESFLPKLLDVLRAGGSDEPTRILQRIGVDITDAGFWQKGLSLLRGMLSEYEAAL
jgi:oligoendopeptidase F